MNGMPDVPFSLCWGKLSCIQKLLGGKRRYKRGEGQAYDSVAAHTIPAKKKPNLNMKLVWQGLCPVRSGLFGFNCANLLLILCFSCPVLCPGMWPQAHSAARAWRTLRVSSPTSCQSRAALQWDGLIRAWPTWCCSTTT